MLKIHKPFSKKLCVIGITSILGVGALLGLRLLTYTTELSHAEQVTYPSLSNITYMQDMNADICKHSHENETKQLIDTRDGKTYWVTKLKDENCWMTQNLEIINKTISSVDSDMTSGSFTIPVSDKAGFNSGDQYQPKAYYEAPYGGYYNLYTATAGSGGAELTYGYASSSICPKGWKLPADESEGSYMSLFNEYGEHQDSSLIFGKQNILMQPISFILGGALASNNMVHVGVGARYWTSRISSSQYAYALSIQGNDVFMAPNSVRQYGYSVRCIARTDPPETRTLSDLTYMQDMTMDVCKNSDIEETKQLIDKRDNKTYWVAKLKDNNCWMTQNLALDLSASTPLTPADSDVSTSWTPPANTQQGTITKFPSSSDRTFSYNPGEYIYTTPMEQHNCGSSGIAKLEGCPNWKLTFGLSKDIGDNKQAHYLAGNYYSYEVATAGSAPASGGASNSICPKGWRLPNTDNYTNLTNGLTASITDTANNIKLAPYYFLYGGYINSGLHLAGSEGRYWSSLAHNNGNSAYFLDFDISILPPRSSANPRSSGFSVRCVAPGGEKAIIDNNNIKVTINPQLSLDVASETIVNKTDANPSTGDLKVKVSSNQPYIVQLSSNDATMKSSTTSTTIPAKSGLLNTTENGWGIMKHGASEYTAITNTPELFYQSASPEVKELLLKVGISTAPDLPSGEYSTDITITATQN